MQESSKYGLPDDCLMIGFDSVPSSPTEMRTLATSFCSSESVMRPTGVTQALRRVLFTIVAHASPVTPWVDVPSVEPESEPSAASSTLGASFGAGAALASSVRLSVGAGALGLGGCTMRGSQNLSRGLPKATSWATIRSRGASI